MSRNTARFFVGLMTCAVIGSVAVRSHLSRAQVATPPPVTIPEGWKRIDLNDFSFYAPPDMKNQNVRGIDSAVWEFRNRALNLNIDYGMYSNDLKSYENQPEYKAEWLYIDGKKAKVATFRMSDEDTAGSPLKDLKYVSAVYFPDVGGGGDTKLTFWANCISPAAQGSARTIFLSLKFK